MVPWATLGYWGFPSFTYENSRGSWNTETMEQDPSSSILLGIPNCANLCVISSTLVDSQFIVEGSLGASRKRYNSNYTLKATRSMYRYRAGDCWVGLWTAV
jgi:hypothetical protein